jgi:hypothetical protein
MTDPIRKLLASPEAIRAVAVEIARCMRQRQADIVAEQKNAANEAFNAAVQKVIADIAAQLAKLAADVDAIKRADAQRRQLAEANAAFKPNGALWHYIRGTSEEYSNAA